MSSLQRLAVPSAFLVQHPLDHAGGVFKHLLVRHLDHRFLRWSEETPDLMQERRAAPRQLVQFTADTTQLLDRDTAVSQNQSRVVMDFRLPILTDLHERTRQPDTVKNIRRSHADKPGEKLRRTSVFP